MAAAVQRGKLAPDQRAAALARAGVFNRRGDVSLSAAPHGRG